MPQSAVAVAADYAEGLLTARRVKNGLTLILAVLLIGEISLFFIGRYKVDLAPRAASVTTQPVAGHLPTGMDLLKYGVGLVGFLGLITPLLLAADLLLIVNIMLVGRLVGLTRLMHALIACVFLTLLLFPWQAFLINQAFTSREFVIPGVLYTWSDLTARARIVPDNFATAICLWGRFVAMPVAALALLAAVAWQTRRGLRMALGQDLPTPIAKPT